jgi:hypothetical protein
VVNATAIVLTTGVRNKIGLLFPKRPCDCQAWTDTLANEARAPASEHHSAKRNKRA